MILRLEPHLGAAFLASSAMLSILDVLPDEDLAAEIRNLANIQIALLQHVFEGKHYGTDAIHDLMDYMHDVKRQMSKIKESRY